MNILMLGRWLPPPRHPVRAMREYQFAHQLTRSHRLTVAFITDNSDSGGAISALRSEFGDLEFAAVPRGWKSLASAVRLATGESCTLSYSRSEALRTRLADRMRRTQYDVVVVSASSMIPYALDVDLAIPVVMDFGDVESEWWVRQSTRGLFAATRFFRAEAVRLRSVEAEAAHRARRSVAATPEAAQIVSSLGPVSPPTIIPNGVDMAWFAGPLRSATGPAVVFCASMRDEAQIRESSGFYRSIVETVRARFPAARFVLASKDPMGSGAALLGFELAAPISDLRPLLHSQAVAVAPLGAGSDLRSAVLEPMAAGVPVVVSSTVRDRLGAVGGRDLHVADDAIDFGRHVVHLLESDSMRAEMSAQGRRFVQTHFSWEVCAARFESLVAEVVKPDGAASSRSEAQPIQAALGG